MRYSLRGSLKGEEYEVVSEDIRYLQKLLIKILRNDGSGFIWRKI